VESPRGALVLRLCGIILVESPRVALFLRLGEIILVESPGAAVFLRLGGITLVESPRVALSMRSTLPVFRSLLVPVSGAMLGLPHSFCPYASGIPCCVPMHNLIHAKRDGVY
jgi:hypothetical protein